MYNFAKYAELNHTHKEKVFKEKKLDTLSQDQGLRSMYQLFLHKNTKIYWVINFLNFVNF